MEYRILIPWELIISVLVLIMLIVLGVVAVAMKRRRAETTRDTGYDSGTYYNSPSDTSTGEVPRNYCPYCGIRLYTGSGYCANCGRSVDKLSK